jgi:hypothetical protein
MIADTNKNTSGEKNPRTTSAEPTIGVMPRMYGIISATPLPIAAIAM